MNEQKILILEHLRKKARQAYSGLSFDPEKRADTTVSDYSSELEADLCIIPEVEKERYTQKYTTLLSAWLHSLSNTYSAMIAGPSNFPARMMEKRKRWADNKYQAFREWRTRALKAIARNVERNKSPEEKRNERWEKIRKNIIDHASTIILVDRGDPQYDRNLFVRAITGTIKTLAEEGNVELLNRALELVRELNTKGPKPIITDKNTIWDLLPRAEQVQQTKCEETPKESEEKEVNGIRIVYNYQEERVQIFFRDKAHSLPYHEALKGAAWRWKPSIEAWQRKLTNAAKYAAEKIASMTV